MNYSNSDINNHTDLKMQYIRGVFSGHNHLLSAANSCKLSEHRENMLTVIDRVVPFSSMMLSFSDVPEVSIFR